MYGKRAASDVQVPLLPLLDAVCVNYVEGSVDEIAVGEKTVRVIAASGATCTLGYVRLLLTSGSKLSWPSIPWLAEYAFSVDCMEDTHRHLKAI